MPKRLVIGYASWLKRSPYLAQSLTASVLVGTGDVLAQFVVEKANLKTYDIKRTCRFAGIGLFLVGPVLYKWYSSLEKFIKPGKLHGVKKMFFDQFVFAPPFLAAFVSTVRLSQGDDFLTVRNKLSADFGGILRANYSLWPLVQLFNFYLTPIHFRVLVVNLVSVGWNTYISYVSERDIDASTAPTLSSHRTHNEDTTYLANDDVTHRTATSALTHKISAQSTR